LPVNKNGRFYLLPINKTLKSTPNQLFSS